MVETLAPGQDVTCLRGPDADREEPSQSQANEQPNETRMNEPKRSYSIAELAAEFSVTPRAIRFYEGEGLLHPRRRGQTRIYSTADRARLAWILRGKRVGFSLAEIAEMLNLYNQENGRSRQRLVTLDKCRERITALESQRDDIDLTIVELDDFCQTLEELITAEKSNDEKSNDEKTATSKEPAE